MKKMMKKVLCLTIALSVILVSAVTVFAEETTSMPITTETVVGSNAEADAAFEKFLKATEVLKQDEYYPSLNVLGGIEPLREKWIVDSGYFTEEEWAALSDYDRMCYIYLYFEFCAKAEAGDYERFFADKQKVKNNFLSGIQSLSKSQRWPEGVYEAFEEIIYWQYQYFLDTGDFYNFMDGSTNLTHKGEQRTEETTTLQASSETTAPITTVATTQASEAKDRLGDKIASNALGIAIFLALVGIGAFLVMKRKKNNKDSIDE